MLAFLCRLVSVNAVLLVILVAACGDGDNTSPTDSLSPSATGTSSETPSATSEPVDTDADVDLVEFAIQPQRTSARPGDVTFHVSNMGELTHEFVVIRTDLPHAQLPRLENNQGADESQLDVVGRTDPFEPGDQAEIALTLGTGNYVLICNLVTDSTSHYLSGMYDRFTISDSAPLPDSTRQ